jgi:hypothetical protein
MSGMMDKVKEKVGQKLDQKVYFNGCDPDSLLETFN